MLSPMPRQIHARTGRNLVSPGLVTLDVKGNPAPNGQYYFQIGIGLGSILLPDFAGIDLDLLNTPVSFSGIPWNLDRRLSPRGCDGACEASAQPLDPFPFEGMDPRTQANTPVVSYLDPNFNRGILGVTNNRVLSYVSGTPVGGLFNFDGNNTILAWPPVTRPYGAGGATVVPQVPWSAPHFRAYSTRAYFTISGGRHKSLLVYGALTYSLARSVGDRQLDRIDQWIGALRSLQSGNRRVTDPINFDTQSFVIEADAWRIKSGFQRRPLGLDISSGGVFDGLLTVRMFRTQAPGVVRVTGDWNGTGTTEIGVYDNGNWFLDNNGNGAWDGTPTDLFYVFGAGMTGAIPVTGKWDGSGATKIGIYSDGLWFLDMNGNGAWDGEPTDRIASFRARSCRRSPGNWDGERDEYRDIRGRYLVSGC
jgi:hypothetical protein